VAYHWPTKVVDCSPDQLRLAVAYLARFKGSSRYHTVVPAILARLCLRG